MKGNIAHGAGYLTRGARMLSHPKLRLFVIIPLMVNILIFGSLIGIGLRLPQRHDGITAVGLFRTGWVSSSGFCGH